jgi:hypothetical protein
VQGVVLKFNPVLDLVNLGLEPGQVEKKQGKKKPGVTWLTRLVDSATRLT